MVKKSDLPPAPPGMVRVIDDAKLEGVVLTEDGFETVLDVRDHHLEDKDGC